MTLYTIMPMDAIWEGSLKEPEPTVDIAIGSGLMQVIPIDHNRAQIVRLLNCPLDYYLNPVYSPGQMIQYIPILHNQS
ncbi:YlzJ-like family protein [Paenibacillus sp. CMAA1364]